MSGLDAFIPQPQDPADLPAALRKFAEWVEAQKTAMEASVRAEVAKVNQDTIIANVLDRMPKGLSLLRVDLVRATKNVAKPQGATLLRAFVRSGNAFAYDRNQHVFVPPNTNIGWIEVSERDNVAECILGGDSSTSGSVPNTEGTGASSVTLGARKVIATPLRVTGVQFHRVPSGKENPGGAYILLEWFKGERGRYTY